MSNSQRLTRIPVLERQEGGCRMAVRPLISAYNEPL